MIKKLLLLSILLCNIMVAKPITITTGEWQPWISETLKEDGVAIDIVKSIFESQGLETKFEFYPWKRAYNLAKNGKVDATAIWYKNRERKNDFLISKPIFSTQDVIIYKKGEKIIFNTLADLKKYKVALTRGYSYGQEIDDMVKTNQIKVKWVNSDLLALKQIEKRNNFDIFICAKSVAKSLIADNFKNSTIFKFYPKSTKNNPLFFMVSKKVKNGEKLITAFNKGLKEFKSKGLIKKMIDNSFQGKYK